MSLRSYQTKDGARWQVQWRDSQKKLRGRTFTSKTEALAFDGDIKAKKFKGESLPRASKQSLAAAYEEWERLRGPNLAPATLAVYKSVWNAHVKDRFDGHPIGQLASDPQLFEELITDMRERGVGPASQRKVLVVMSAVLSAAVEWRKISTNPLWRMRKPAAPRLHHPRPFPPLIIERIRLLIRQRDAKSGPSRARADACLVTLMAYGGLRPGEALALTWGDIGQRTISVDKAMRDGTIGPTKTGTIRTVPLSRSLQVDLQQLRATLVDVQTKADKLVIPSHDGKLWTKSEFDNWRTRVWKPALETLATGKPPQPHLATARPYDCRGSFVSLQLRAGASPLEVASWAGHSPAVMFRHYAHVIEELRGEPIIDVDKQILRARVLVRDMQEQELAKLLADLLDNPSAIAMPSVLPDGYEGPGKAAVMLYGERDLVTV